MRSLTADRRNRRYIDRLAAFDFLPGPPFGVPPPPKKRKLFSAPSSTRRLLPLCAPLIRVIHGPRRVLKASDARLRRRVPSVRASWRRVLKASDAGLRRRVPSARASWIGLSFRMGNLWSWLSRPKRTSLSSSSRRGERAPGGQDDSHDGLGLRLEEYKERFVVSQDGCSSCRSLRFGFSPADLTFVTRDEEELHEVHVLNRKVGDSGRMTLNSLPSLKNRAHAEKSMYKELQDQIKMHDTRLGDSEFEAKLDEENVSRFRIARKAEKEKPNKDLYAPFTPLTVEEEDEVRHALCGGGRHEILVRHGASNIEITREILGCLSSRSWLNDDVINLYLELLKERERRDPEQFLRCHFFNTFFYKKLTGSDIGYDFKAVRRWTAQKKLGYTLIECDKIFIPIHKNIHWCLAVINVRDKTFQYLDSLGETDKVLIGVLARYLMDEVKDKNNVKIDTRSWRQESIHNLPQQKNGWDCGMFMLKYIDFHSRDLSLSFSQEHMAYFRKRTAKEILRLRAE